MAITLNGTTGITSTGAYSSDGISFADDTPSNTLVTTTGGNVGIGTSSPTAKTTISSVAGSVPTGQLLVKDPNASGIALAQGTSGEGYLWNLTAGSSGYMTFGTGATERMRVDSAGNLLVGVTSGFTHRLWKNNAGGVVTDIANTSSTAGSRCLELSMGTSADATGTFIRCADNGAFRFQVLGNGNAQNTNNSYGALSDIKLKENIVDATPKLEKLNQVRIVNYNLIGEEQKQIGVIAQELEQVFPSMVDEMPDRDKEGNDLGTTTKSVKYSVFVPMLIKAIQEQQAIITDLKSRIEALEQA
jgi:hypothetical protein